MPSDDWRCWRRKKKEGETEDERKKEGERNRKERGPSGEEVARIARLLGGLELG